MTARELRRAAVLDRIVDHMLSRGLAPSTLRALAEATGTSDRMLIYYFSNKETLVTAALALIGDRMGATLLAALPPAPLAPDAVLAALATLVRGPALRPHMRMWLELVVLAARGEEPFRTIAGQLADRFIAFVEDRLDLGSDAARRAASCRIVAQVDGMVLLDCAGRAAFADQALTAATIRQ